MRKKLHFVLFVFVSNTLLLNDIAMSQTFPADSYKKALWMTTRFYGAQRSGHGPNWLINNHQPTNVPQALQGNLGSYVTGKSFIKDADSGYDLTGGWFDCGDHVKFGQTLFYSAYMLALGYSEFPAGYDDLYSFDYNGYVAADDFSWEGGRGAANGIPDVLDELKYATDYFQKCIRGQTKFYYQVGNGDVDHKHWVTAPVMSTLAVSEGGEADGSRQIYSATGNVTSMASLCGATLAVMARVYKKFDPDYASQCESKAVDCYQFVLNSTKGNTGGGSYYPAKPDWKPDVVIMSMELYRLTGQAQYMTTANTNKDGLRNHYHSLCYNNTDDLGAYLLALYGDTDARDLLNLLVNSYKPGSGYFLNVKNDTWGVCRYPANQSFVLALHDKLNNATTLNPYVNKSVSYILGDNSKSFSYIVGYGNNHPQYPHHRNFYRNDQDCETCSEPTVKYKQLGYMTGGSLNDGAYNDNIKQYTYSEGGIDYNCGLVAALGYIVSMIDPVDTNKFGHPTPSLGEPQSICGVSSITLHANLATDGVKTFTWYRNSLVVQAASVNANSYQVTSAGTYTCVLDSAGQWSTQASVDILGELSQPDLGEDVLLCDPAMTTLDMGVAGGGIAYEWRLDGSVLSAETGQSLDVFKAGTYRGTVSASGCSATYDEVVVTSSLPEAAYDTVCVAGMVDLEVAGEGPFEWYDEADGGTLLHTGNTFAVHVSENTTFYVAEGGAVSTTAGPSQQAHTLSGGQNSGQVGIRFTAEKAFSIIGFTGLPFVYSCNGDQVKVTVELKQGSTSIGVYSSAEITCAGVQSGTPYDDFYAFTFDPPIQLPGAGDYTLTPNTSGNTLVWFDSGANFGAYDAPGVMDITDDTRDDKTSSYPGIFDILLQAGSSCARVPVLAVIDQNHAGCVVTEIVQNHQQGVTIHPNPASEYLLVDHGMPSALLELFDITGTLTLSVELNRGRASIDLSGFANGVYFCRITSHLGTRETTRLIVKK